MRRHFPALVVMALLATNLHAQQKPPDIERTLVAGGQGYFPVALRLKDGRMAVVMRGGAPHLGRAGRLDIVFSSDEGKSWTNPTVVADSPADDRNPALGQAADGTLVVAFWRTDRYDEQGRYRPNLNKPVNTWVTRSADGGKTWSAPAEIDVSDIGYGSPYGRMITLDDGAMLMNIYGGAVRPSDFKGDCSYIYRSDDAGKAWKRFATPGARGFNETALLRLKSGALLAAMRSDSQQQIFLTESRDEGKTWSEPKKLTPPQVHPADMILLSDGRVLMVVGHRAGPMGVCALVGNERGEFAWDQRSFIVDDATNGDCGYPSSVLLKDGRVLTAYYAVGSKRFADWGTHCGAAVHRVSPAP